MARDAQQAGDGNCEWLVGRVRPLPADCQRTPKRSFLVQDIGGDDEFVEILRVCDGMESPAPAPAPVGAPVGAPAAAAQHEHSMSVSRG